MLVRLQGVTKRYGRVEALNGVDLELRPGEVVGLLGPNGSGKTTLLKLIAGLLRPDRGKVEVLEGDPRRLKGSIAYLPERRFLPAWVDRRAAERLMAGAFPRFRPERFRALLDELSVPARPVGRMSKGEAQRLELALVLAQDVGLYLLDEPLGGIDLVSRERILLSLIRAWRGDAALVVATHAIVEAESLFERVVFLREGRVVLDRAAEEIRHEGRSVREAFLEVFSNEGVPLA